MYQRRCDEMKPLDLSITYAGRSEHVAIGAFAEVVAGSNIAVDIFAKESLKFPLPDCET